MKKNLIALLTIAFCFISASYAFAAFTEIKNYHITVTIPESVQTEESAPEQKNAEEIKKPQENMTIIERVWRDSQILLVKTNVVK